MFLPYLSVMVSLKSRRLSCVFLIVYHSFPLHGKSFIIFSKASDPMPNRFREKENLLPAKNVVDKISAICDNIHRIILKNNLLFSINKEVKP